MRYVYCGILARNNENKGVEIKRCYNMECEKCRLILGYHWICKECANEERLMGPITYSTCPLCKEEKILYLVGE